MGTGATVRSVSERWLLITISTSKAPSSLRVHAWRRLRRLGANYLQQSVCVLPERPATVRAVTRLLAKVRDDGGEGRLLHISLADAREETELIGAFCAERSDEYAEVVSRTQAFFAEIAMERGRGRATYTEVEESEADLKRLQRWLASIHARDYFDADGYREAAAAVTRCEEALAVFEAEAFAQELPESQPDAAIPPRRLRAVAPPGAEAS